MAKDKDIIIKPSYEQGGYWSMATLRLNTKRAADVYNDYFGTNKSKGDSFIVSHKKWDDDIKVMAECASLESWFS